ncbi:hypothetical protein EMIT079MI2_20219 [Bacillus sp. IT-79MI2]
MNGKKNSNPLCKYKTNLHRFYIDFTSSSHEIHKDDYNIIFIYKL